MKRKVSTFLVVVSIFLALGTSPTLALSSSDVTVTTLQTFLENKGLLVMPSDSSKGYFGTLTKQALINYQKSVGLPSDGDFGPLTKSKIAAELSQTQTTTTTVINNTTPSSPTDLSQTIGRDEFESRLQSLSNTFNAKLSSIPNSSGGGGGSVDLSGVYQMIAQSQKIDSLTNTTLANPTITNPSITGGSLSGMSISSPSITGIATFSGSIGASSVTTGTSGFTVTRQEPTPTAPTVAQVTDGTGNCTAGTHVFAVVFNTVAGHTDVSPSSSTVICDGAHTKVSVTIPQSKMYVITRDIYASKANTTSPLYLVSASPVISFAVANSDQGDSNTYTFNIDDNSLTTTVAPTTNTAIDPAYSFGIDGQVSFGSGASLHSLSSSLGWQASISGSPTVGTFQRLDPGEARLTIVSGGITAPNKFNYPELVLLNPGIVVGANSAVSYTPLAANSEIGALNVRGTYTTGGSFSCSGCVGFDWLTTENWTAAANGVALKVRLMKTGLPLNANWTPLSIDSINGSVFTGATADNTTYAMQVNDSNNSPIFTIKDGGFIGIGTSTSQYLLSLASSTAPQLSLSSGAGLSQWVFRNAGGNLYLATTTVAGTATSTLSALTILTGNGFVGIGTNSPSAPLEVKGSGTGATIAKFTDGNSTGCTLATGGTISCSSDIRLKKNITDLPYGLIDVMKLHPVTFNWNYQPDTATTTPGFIAQEVEQIMPGLISTDDNGHEQLNTIGIIPALTRAVQDLSHKFDSINTTLTSWFADSSNGIEKFFAVEVDTANLCVTNSNGKTCINRDQLDALLNNAGQSGNQGGSVSDDSSTGDSSGNATTTDSGGDSSADNATTTSQ